MKSVLGILCACLLAGQGFALQPLACQPQTTLVYDGITRFSAQIPELDDSQMSAFSMTYKLLLTCINPTQISIQIKNVRTARVNGDIPESYDDDDIDFHHTAAPEMEAELSKPILAHYADGLITEYELEEDEKEWSKNIKRSILSLNQLDLAKNGRPVPHQQGNKEREIHPDAPLFNVFESDIMGECPTKYTVYQTPSLDDPNTSSDVLNVTKVKNYQGCLEAPQYGYHNFESQGCSSVCNNPSKSLPRQPVQGYPPTWDFGESDYESGCPYGFEPDYQPVKAFSITKYNVSQASTKPIIEEIEHEHTIVYELNGNELILFTRQYLNLTAIRPSKEQVQLSKPEKHEKLTYQLPTEDLENDMRTPGSPLDLPYLSIFGPSNDYEMKNLVLKKLEDVVEDIVTDNPVSSEKAGPKVIEITNAVNSLSQNKLEEITGQLENQHVQKVPRKQALMRSLWLEILALSPSNEAAKHCIELIKAARVTHQEAANLLEGMAKNLESPHPRVIEALLDLLDQQPMPGKRPLTNSLAIAIGKLVDQACVDPELTNSWEYSDDEPESSHSASHQAKPQQPRYPPQSPQSRRQSQPGRSPKPTNNRHARAATDEDDESDSQEGRDGSSSKECTPQKLEKYIKRVAQKLSAAKKPNKMAIYIESLAHMTSSKVLPILEPFVTGEAPELEPLNDEETSFIQDVTTYALHHVADDHPDVVLPIVVSIYFDQSVDYSQRIAAFSVMMVCDPPLSLYHRIVSELRDEINNQVGSYVFSHLSQIANSSLPCKRSQAQMIQSVISQAPDDFEDTGIQFSQSWGADFYDDELDFGVEGKVSWVAHNESVIPRSAYASLSHLLGPFSSDILEIGYNAKGIDTLIEKLLQPGGVLSQVISQNGASVDTQNVQRLVEMVKEKLKLEDDDDETPRATIFCKLFGRTSYFTLDEQRMMSLIESAVNWVRNMNPTDGHHGQFVKVWMPDTMFYFLPSGSGFPAVINHRNPIIVYGSLESARASAGTPNESPFKTPVALSSIIRFSAQVSSVSMAYIINPCEDLIYGTGVHRVYEVSTPFVLGLAVNLKSQTCAVSIKPKLPHRLAYHKTSPVTFITAAVLITPPKGDLMDDSKEIETLNEPFKFDTEGESQAFGLAYSLRVRTEKVWGDQPFWLSRTAYEDGTFASLVKVLKNPSMKAREAHLYLEPHSQEAASQFVFTLDYNRTLSKPNSRASDYEDENDTYEMNEDEDDKFVRYNDVVSHIYRKSGKHVETENTIEELIEQTRATWSPALGHGSVAPVPRRINHEWEASLIVMGSGSQAKHFAGRLVYAHSLDHRHIWVQLNGHKSSSYGPPKKLCAAYAIAYPPQPSPFYLEMNTLRSQQAKIHATVAWGEDCTADEQIVIRGLLEKTDEQLSGSSDNYVDTPEGIKSRAWYFEQCEIDRQDGETLSYPCELAKYDASTLNQLTFEIVSRHVTPRMRNYTHQMDLALKAHWYPNMESNPLTKNPRDTLTVVVESIEAIPDLDLTNIRLEKPYETVQYSKLYTPYYEPPSTLDSFKDQYLDQLFGGEYNAECYLMEDHIRTFDNVTFEANDDKCQYLLVQEDDSSPDFTIIVSQIDLKAKTKALTIVAAGHTVKLLPPVANEFPVVINDKDVSISQSKVLNFNEISEVQIYVTKTVSPAAANVLTLELPGMGITIQYDGKNAIVQIPRDYKGDTIGICGDFNDEQYQEFSGPNGCIYADEEDFQRAYALPGQNCPNPTKPGTPDFCPPSKDDEENSQEEQIKPHSSQPGRQQPSQDSTGSNRKPFSPRKSQEPSPSKSHRRPQSQDDEDENEDEDTSAQWKRPLVKKPVNDEDEPEDQWQNSQRAQLSRQNPEAQHPSSRRQPAQHPAGRQSWQEEDEPSSRKQPSRADRQQNPDDESQEDEQDQPSQHSAAPKIPTGAQDCIRPKTVVRVDEERQRYCFTTVKMYDCQAHSGCQGKQFETPRVPFKCLPMSSPEAKRYFKKTERGQLVTEILGMPNDEMKSVKIPTHCTN